MKGHKAHEGGEERGFLRIVIELLGAMLLLSLAGGVDVN